MSLHSLSHFRFKLYLNSVHGNVCFQSMDRVILLHGIMSDFSFLDMMSDFIA